MKQLNHIVVLVFAFVCFTLDTTAQPYERVAHSFGVNAYYGPASWYLKNNYEKGETPYNFELSGFYEIQVAKSERTVVRFGLSIGRFGSSYAGNVIDTSSNMQLPANQFVYYNYYGVNAGLRKAISWPFNLTYITYLKYHKVQTVDIITDYLPDETYAEEDLWALGLAIQLQYDVKLSRSFYLSPYLKYSMNAAFTDWILAGPTGDFFGGFYGGIEVLYRL
ncbi:hypothetical protein [Phaeocystidibacter luteus]|uniref:Uncharacterized protein n=1 Tax=Phaeocystidibacter luteus TaxID=911197 RepID=A0A6N6RGZ8_9FLAO|nr:hypothetical protein [Phaeocystidibacter luteus]KAB2808609.1 hypothetical protein F8C67_09995 [Phaeocystidibacter luteus]